MIGRPGPRRRWVALLAAVGVALAVAGLILVARGPEAGDTAAPAADPAREPRPASAPAGETAPVEAPGPATEPPSSRPDEPSEPTSTTVPAEVVVVPTRVRIASIGVDAPMVGLGLTDDGRLEVPEDPGETGWYLGRSIPGDMGPSVVVGHVDSTAGPAVFHDLRHLDVGDTVELDRSDGLVAVFRVTDIVHVNKQAFPTEQVYGPTDVPTLRLVTCTGAFDEESRSYVDNVIVYGAHLGNRAGTNGGAGAPL